MAKRPPSSIKTINQKIRRLGRKYGTESIEYQKYISDLDRNFGIHYTKDGIIQINQPKTISKYQQQIMVKLQGRKGIRELEAAAKERITKDKPKGYKPTKAEIEQEVRQFSLRQSKIDDLLDSIYIEEGEGSLPSDISIIYNKIHRHGKGSGSGVSNADLDYLIDSMERWKKAKARIQQLAQHIESLGIGDDYIDSEIWAAMSGRYSLPDIEDMVIPELEQRIADHYN